MHIILKAHGDIFAEIDADKGFSAQAADAEAGTALAVKLLRDDCLHGFCIGRDGHYLSAFVAPRFERFPWQADASAVYGSDAIDDETLRKLRTVIAVFTDIEHSAELGYTLIKQQVGHKITLYLWYLVWALIWKAR